MATGSDAVVRSFDRVMKKLEAAPATVTIRLKDDGAPVDVKVSGFGLQRVMIEDLGDSKDFIGRSSPGPP